MTARRESLSTNAAGNAMVSVWKWVKTMKNGWMHWIAMGSILVTSTALHLPAQTPATTAGPVELRVDHLKNPLGIDDPKPKFSWQLRDSALGTRQTAYEIRIATRAGLLDAGKADLWSSGRIAQDNSLEVPYAGPALKPFTRYYWHVEVFGAEGKKYPVSETGWFETGLMDQAGWRGEWIGYETPEEIAERGAKAEWINNPDAKSPEMAKLAEQRFAYRATVKLDKPVKFAALYATARDTVSAWINGAQVLTESPLPAWKQLPWKKYVRAEVTQQLSTGENTLAIEDLHYVVNPNGLATDDAPPVIATLVVEYTDGSWTSFASSTGWKTASAAAPGWQQKSFDDSGWKTPVIWQPLSGKRSETLGTPWIPDSVKTLRKSFMVASPVKSARLYATALGAYEIFMNGKRVGDQVLAPGWTDYHQRVVYQTYDVTAQVTEGKNAIGAQLAPGWYQTSLEWFQQPNNYGLTPPALRAMLHIEHADGSVEWIATDESWQAAKSGTYSAEIYDGEKVNLSAGFVGESSPDFDDKWMAEKAMVIHPAPVEIVAQDFQPIRIERELQAKSFSEPKPGVYVYDFGQNFSGVARVQLHNLQNGKIQLRFAEILNPDGTIYTDNLRTAKATDVMEVHSPSQITIDYFPQFTFHGFRYVELTGVPYAPGKDAVTGLVFHTDLPFTAKLETGSAMINQLWSNILWGQRSNFVGLPTDCPQRDERLGWTGDAQVFWRTASYNTDLAAFSRKYAADLRGTQIGSPYYGIFAPGTVRQHEQSSAGWSDAGVIVPWTSWLQTGSTAIIDENWEAMTKYLAAIAAANPGYLWKNELGDEFGDWLSPEGKTDQVLIGSAYWAYDAQLMRQMAHATGRNAEEKQYAELFEKIRSAFQKRFVRADGFVAGADNSKSKFGVINNPDAMSEGGDTQTGYVLALHMNLLPEDLRAAAAKRLADKIHANHDLLGTGFLGTPYLLEVLTQAGNSELAYTLLLNTKYPSWGYMVEHGATTMWERWNGDQMIGDPSMNSYNHYAYGAVAAWMYRYAAGIDATPDDPGFHTVVLHPVFDARMGHIAFDYDSVSGTIHSDWTVTGNKAEWHVTIPANTTGWLPLSAEEINKYKLNGAALNGNSLAHAETRDGQSGFVLAPGSYAFEIQLF